MLLYHCSVKFLSFYNHFKMSTLTEFIIVAVKDNGRIILNSVENCPLVWPTVALENGTVRPKTSEELSDKEKLHTDCDLKSTKIVLQGLPPDVYALVNHYQIQGNTKFLNSLPPEWGKFVTNVKLARDLHTSNYDQLYVYLEQHESNPYGAPHHPQQYPTTYPTNLSHTKPYVTQNAYPPLIIPQQPQVEFPQIDSGLAVPTFLPGDEPIAYMNKAMAFFSAVFTQSTNNQLRSSSNPRNQATVQDGLQGNASGLRENTSGQAKVIKCYNCQGEGHMARQCTQPNRRRDASWFKEKTDDLDSYDFNCYDISLAKVVLMANLSSCDSDVLSEVQYSDTCQNDMMNQSVQELQYSKQAPIIDYPDDEITSDSNIIPYSQYLEETQHRIKPILYDGNVLSKTHDVPSVVDEEVTLILAEESRLKMVEKQNDPIMKKEKINITSINYSKLNKLAKDFGKCFIPQQELSAEQKFWLRSSNKNSKEPSTSNTPVKIEVPSELPKVSFVNKSLKKFRFHLASFDKVVKLRTTPDAITKEAAVEQCSVDKKCFEIQQKQFLIENDRILDKIISQEIVNIVLNSSAIICDSKKKNENSVDTCNKCLEIKLQAKDTVISKLKETIHSLRENVNPAKVKKDIDEIETINIELDHSVDSIKPSRDHAKEQCDSLIANLNSKSMENADLKTQIQENVFANAALKNKLRKLKGKNVIDTAVSKRHATTIAPRRFKLNLEPLALKVLKNKDVHLEYIKHSREHADILWEIVKSARALSPLDCNLDTTYNNKNNIVEDQSRSVKSRKNKKNRVAKTECNAYVMQSVLNANSKSVYAICNECLFDANHDKCVLDYVHDVNVVQIILWYLDSGCSKHMTKNRSQLTNFVNKFLSTVKFGNNQMAKIMVYGDYHTGNVTICRVYYVEGLGHNLFFVGQFCESDLEVAFCKHTCFVCNLEGVDLLTGSCGTNLYTLSIGDMLKSSPICLLSKASKTKSWLWHRFLSHLKFGTINQLAKQGLVREAVATACYTQNHSLIRLHHRKTPYELLHDRKPDLSYLHVFGALCYPTNDSEDLGKLKAKADVGIFIGYAPAKKAY
ncbi:retrovirus-related pol polyprotein from transposon TNT 1-94 [Tanacetum coccineum]